MNRLSATSLVITFAALVGCSSQSGADEPVAEGCREPASDSLTVGIAYDVSGRGDQSFNDSAAAGIDKAACELGLRTQEAEASAGEAQAAKEERLRTLADAGANPIVSVGFAYAPALSEVASEYPDLHFVLVDSADAKGDNIANLVFAEEEGSFLVGAAAGLKTESGKVGFIGGVNDPHINRFEAGFTAGVKAVAPDASVAVRYLTEVPDFSGFNDPAKARVTADGMYQGGVDIIYQAAGGSSAGVFQAAAENDAWAIGVDADQYETADPRVRDHILTSMIKRLDTGVYDYLKSASEGDFSSGLVELRLANDGVSYATSGGFIADVEDKLETLREQVESGEIDVPVAP